MERSANFFSVLVCLLKWHFFASIVVNFASNHGDQNVFLPTILKLFHPIAERVKTLTARWVIHQTDSRRIFVVHGCKWAELLAACRIPNLKFNFYVAHHSLRLYLKLFARKVRPDGAGVACWETSFQIPIHNACLSDVCLAEHDNFERGDARSVHRLISVCHTIIF